MLLLTLIAPFSRFCAQKFVCLLFVVVSDKKILSSPSNPLSLYLLIQMFLVALSFAYFAKALSGSYMKSTITQLERRFDIPSYLIGVIDGSFEIGESSRPSLPSLSPLRLLVPDGEMNGPARYSSCR